MKKVFTITAMMEMRMCCYMCMTFRAPFSDISSIE